MEEDLPGKDTTWRQWYIPLGQDRCTLRQALASSEHIRAEADDIPLMVKLVENPAYDLPGFDIFHGAVNLHDHDCIHAVLGRGLLPKDEAFTIGFTMGSTNRVSSSERKLYTWISQYLYPGPYRFDDEDIQVFNDAVRLAYISDCQSLDTVDYHGLMDMSLRQAREFIGLETNLLRAYYQIEKKRYPDSIASRRLLPDC